MYYDEKKGSPYIQYLDVNNLCGWTMSQKLPVVGFKWVKDVSKINEDFIKNYDEDSNRGYIEYPKNVEQFLPMKVNKCNKLVCNLYDKSNYVVHIRSLRHTLNHGLILKKVRRVIKFNQESWLK